MAIMKPTPADQKETNLNGKIKLAKDNYGIRFKDEEFKMSSTGNPMIVLTSEFVYPESFTAPDGSKVNIAGVELRKHYIVLRVKDKETGEIDAKKSQDAFNRYCDLRKALGIPVDEQEGIDIENPPKVFKGLVADAICDGEEYVQRKEPTPEQRSKGQLGDIIKDSNGNEIKSYSPVIVSILGAGNTSLAGAPKAY